MHSNNQRMARLLEPSSAKVQDSRAKRCAVSVADRNGGDDDGTDFRYGCRLWYGH